MTIPRLPSGLCVAASGYSIGDPGGVRRTGVAGGYARYANSYLRGSQQFQITIIATEAQHNIWTVFYHRKINKGAISFEMDLNSGSGLQAHSCNIVPGSYSSAALGGNNWSISFVVEATATVYELSQEQADDLLELHEAYGDDLDPLLKRLAKLVLVDMAVLEVGDGS